MNDRARSNRPDVVRYYHRRESRVGYMVVLGGTKHFGYYASRQSMWSFARALRQMEDQLAIALGLAPRSRVLDAGSGMGDVARRMAGVHGLDVTGVDVLGFNLEEARRKIARHGLSDSVRFFDMDYSDLAFEASTFDGVYTMETLVHAGSAEAVLSEFYRVLRPGGRIAMAEYSRSRDEEISEPSRRAFREVNRLAAMPSFQRFTHGVLESLMADAGFVGIEARDVTANMLPMLRAFSLMAWLPYSIARLLGAEEKVVNAMSAVEFWKHRADIRYRIYSAVKPA